MPIFILNFNNMNMKIISIFFLSFFMFNSILAQADSCKHFNGYFLYYVNLNNDTVDDFFSKQDFLTHLKDSSNISALDSVFLFQNIVFVEKSFPTATSAFLEHSVSVYSSSDTLENYLSSFSNSFNLVEFVCFNYQITSVKNKIKEISIAIYPNPISDYLNIELKNIKSNIQFKLIDFKGKVIKESIIKKNGFITFNELKLAKGIYVAQFWSEEKFYSVNIIKN